MFKSEVIRNNLNPSWKVLQMSMQQLCNGDPHRPLLIECFDWNKDGKHEIIGAVTTSLDALAQLYVSWMQCRDAIDAADTRVLPMCCSAQLLQSMCHPFLHIRCRRWATDVMLCTLVAVDGLPM